MTEDAKEGIEAFGERRKPTWPGKSEYRDPEDSLADCFQWAGRWKESWVALSLSLAMAPKYTRQISLNIFEFARKSVAGVTALR